MDETVLSGDNMIIYKITNLINNKVYIGKTTKTIEWRFKKHCYDAKKNPNTKNHFHRALLKYGPENFIIEQIDSADTKIALNEKEQYWINYYRSIINGYNMTPGGDGGNTYTALSRDELALVKIKISEKNHGSLNGNSRQIKCRSIITNQELFFETVTACAAYFEIQNRTQICNRASGKCKWLFRDEWQIAYQDNEYLPVGKYNPSTKHGQLVKLVKDAEEFTFASKNKAIEFLGATKATFVKVATAKGYQIIL